MTRTIFLVLAVASLAACTKTDPAPAPAPAPSATVSAAVVASASAAPVASASAAPINSADFVTDCGSKDKPCPLQGWMRENVNPPMNKNDLPGLAVALDKIAAFAPAGYTNWASISHDGAAAARSGDGQATKASCRSCHDQYKQKYKTEMRGRKI